MHTVVDYNLCSPTALKGACFLFGLVYEDKRHDIICTDSKYKHSDILEGSKTFDSVKKTDPDKKHFQLEKHSSDQSEAPNQQIWL